MAGRLQGAAQRTAVERSDADQADVILRALAAEQAPVTIAKLRAALPAMYRGSPASFRAAVEALGATERVWLFSAGGKKPPLVWDRPPQVLAESIIAGVVGSQKAPLSPADIEKKTRTKLKMLTVAERREVVDSLVASGRLFRWPKKPKGRTELIWSRPPRAHEYLEAALAAFDKAVNELADAFADVGLDPHEVRTAALDAIRSREWAGGLSWSPATPAPANGTRVAQPTDDDAILEILAERMALIDPTSRSGAPVLVSDLRPAVDFLFPQAARFDEALVRLERAGKLSLLRYDPALSAQPLGPDALVTDGRNTYSGVALR